MPTKLDQWKTGELSDSEFAIHIAGELSDLALHMRQKDNERYWYHLEQLQDGDWVNVSNKLYTPILLTVRESWAINQTVKAGYRWQALTNT